MSAKRHDNSHSTDAVKLALMLSELRLPAMKQMLSGFAERADTEGWSAARLLSTLALSSNWPNATGGELNVTSKKHGWCTVKPSPASTSMWCLSSPSPKSWHCRPAMCGSTMVTTC